MELILIRHGLPLRIETVDGQPADPDLSDLGHQQAALMAATLEQEHIDAIYSSPMNRAQQTAEPLAAIKELGFDVVDGVAEYDRHADSYIPVEQLKMIDYERWRRLMRGETDVDFDDFSHEVVTSLETIVAGNPGRRVAVTCHGGVINVWTAHVIGFAPRLFFNPDYTSINRYMCASSGERSVITLNEAVHLRDVQG